MIFQACSNTDDQKTDSKKGSKNAVKVKGEVPESCSLPAFPLQIMNLFRGLRERKVRHLPTNNQLLFRGFHRKRLMYSYRVSR